jgi:hypothetical protein
MQHLFAVRARSFLMPVVFGSALIGQGACSPPSAEAAFDVTAAGDCLEASERWIEARASGAQVSSPWKRVLTGDPEGSYSERSAYQLAGTTLEFVRSIVRSGSVTVRLQRRASATMWEGAEIGMPSCEPQPLARIEEIAAPASKDPSRLDDATTRALLAAHPNMWALVISPEMPLSFDAIRPIHEIARRKGTPLVLVLAGAYGTPMSPALEAKLRPFVADEHVPLYRLDPTNALVLDGIANHFPNLALFEGGAFKGLVSGYKNQDAYESFIADALGRVPDPAPVASAHLEELRGSLAAMRRVKLVGENEESITLGISYLGSYYRPLRSSGVLLFPQNDVNGLYAFDLRNRTAHPIATGSDGIEPYDIVGLPFTDTTALIFSTSSPYTNALLDLAGPLAPTPTPYRKIHVEPSGNIYPSGGLLEVSGDVSTYQILSNWGATQIQEMRFKKEPRGLTFESRTEPQTICRETFLSTPHIVPRGRFVTATINGIGTLLDFDRGQRCDAVYSFGVAASKIDSNEDASRFLFHGGYLELAGARFSARWNGAFVLDRPSGLIQKINVGAHAAASTTYPSFLSGDKVVYYAAQSRANPAVVLMNLTRKSLD